MKIDQLAVCVLQALQRAHMTLATAESCTGGGIGQALTAIPGSSSVYLGGVIAYANSVKQSLLGVPAQTLQTVGAVSEQTAAFMAQSAGQAVGADVAVSVTGIAGPASDGSEKPVGLVYIGVCTKDGVSVTEHHFSGDREAVRTQTIEAALKQVLEAVS